MVYASVKNDSFFLATALKVLYSTSQQTHTETVFKNNIENIHTKMQNHKNKIKLILNWYDFILPVSTGSGG